MSVVYQKYPPATQPGQLEVVVPPFTPLSLSNLVAWCQGDNVNVSGSDITQINDKSGNGHHVPAVNSPLLISADAGYNGKDTIEFDDAATEYCRLATGTIIANNYNVIVIGNTDDLTAGTVGSTMIDTGTVNDALLYRRLNPFGLGAFSGGQSFGGDKDTAPGDTDPHWFEVYWDGINSTVTVDNVQVATAGGVDPGTPTTAGITIGARGNGTNPWSGRIACIIITSSLITGTDRTNLVDWVNTEFGLAI